jgi:hypothetical protein
MSIRIQLKRDLSHNWTLHNPILLNGEIGIETDTLKFKIGNGGRWNDQTSYAFKLGEANGVAMLNSEGKLAVSQLPTSFSINADIANALSLLSTTNLPEGTNKYFTNARALAAVGSAISDAILLETSARNQAIATAKTEATSISATDATTKANAARAAAEATAAADATSKSNAAQAAAVTTASANTDSKISTYGATVTGAISSAINTEAIARNSAITSAINAITTTDIEEGTNKYFTDARAVAAISGTLTTTNITEGTNKYFTNAKARDAVIDDISDAEGRLLDQITGLTAPSGAVTNLINTRVAEADRNIASGFAGLDSNGLILPSVVPPSIARKTDIDASVAALVDSAPSTLNTLNELATALTANQGGVTSLNTAIGLKLSSLEAADTYATKTSVNLKAPIANPTFTGTVTIPAGASITGYPTTIAMDAAILLASNTLKNTVDESGYVKNADRNLASGFAGLTASGYILPAVIQDGSITNTKLANSQITINGSAVSLGGNLTVTAGYKNSNNTVGSNVISYGSTATPPAGTAVGDIYIQY